MPPQTAYEIPSDLEMRKFFAELTSKEDGLQSLPETPTSAQPVDKLMSKAVEWKSKLDQAHLAVEKLADLEHGWDGYNAPRIEAAILAAAKELVNRVVLKFPWAPAVVPMSNGSCQFEWHRGNRTLELEFENAQDIHFLQWDSDSGVEEEAILPVSAVQEIEKLLDWFTEETNG